MPEHVTFMVPEESAGERLDKWLAAPERDLQMTRSAVQLRMEQQAVLVNGTPVPKNYRQRGGDVIEITLPEPEPLTLEPENIPLDIVYEDADLLVVNKP